MEFNEIKGRSIKSIESVSEGCESIYFNFTDGTCAVAEHMQDCCESVYVYSVEGDPASVVGEEILEAVESNEEFSREFDDNESHTWTQQFIRTKSGSVTFVWIGLSNGYYGETPYFRLAQPSM